MNTIYLEVADWLRMNFLRVFRRFVWVEREQFELGSLVNLYLGFNGNSDLQSRVRKLEVLKNRTEKVLRWYNRKAYKEFNELTFRVNNTRVFFEDLCNACCIVHQELVQAQKTYNHLRGIRKLLNLVSSKHQPS